MSASVKHGGRGAPGAAPDGPALRALHTRHFRCREAAGATVLQCGLSAFRDAGVFGLPCPGAAAAAHARHGAPPARAHAHAGGGPAAPHLWQPFIASALRECCGRGGGAGGTAPALTDPGRLFPFEAWLAVCGTVACAMYPSHTLPALALDEFERLVAAPAVARAGGGGALRSWHLRSLGTPEALSAASANGASFARLFAAHASPPRPLGGGDATLTLHAFVGVWAAHAVCPLLVPEERLLAAYAAASGPSMPPLTLSQFVDAACVVALEAFLSSTAPGGRGRSGGEWPLPPSAEVAATIHALVTHVEVEGGAGAAAALSSPDPANVVGRGGRASQRRSTSVPRRPGAASNDAGGGAVARPTRRPRAASGSPSRRVPVVGFREARRERSRAAAAAAVPSPYPPARGMAASRSTAMVTSRASGLVSPASLPRSRRNSGPLALTLLSSMSGAIDEAHVSGAAGAAPGVVGSTAMALALQALAVGDSVDADGRPRVGAVAGLDAASRAVSRGDPTGLSLRGAAAADVFDVNGRAPPPPHFSAAGGGSRRQSHVVVDPADGVAERSRPATPSDSERDDRPASSDSGELTVNGSVSAAGGSVGVATPHSPARGVDGATGVVEHGHTAHRAPHSAQRLVQPVTPAAPPTGGAQAAAELAAGCGDTAPPTVAARWPSSQPQRAWAASPVRTDDPWFLLSARYCVGAAPRGDAPVPSGMGCTLAGFVRLARDVRLPCNSVGYDTILSRCVRAPSARTGLRTGLRTGPRCA